MMRKSLFFAGVLSASALVQSTVVYGEFSMKGGVSFSVQDLAQVVPQGVDDIASRAEELCKTSEEGVASLLAIPAHERTFENTVAELDRVSGAYSYGVDRVSAAMMVHPAKDVRDAAMAARLSLSEKAIDLFMSRELYEAFQEYEADGMKREELTEEQRYYFQETMDSFVRQGFNLAPDKFERVKALGKEISELSTEFGKNIREDTSSIRVKKDELRGVAQGFLQELVVDEEGYVELKADYPTRSAIMGYCENSAVRKAYNEMFVNRAYPENVSVLEKMIAKRDVYAKELGFKSFAHYDLASKMAKDPDVVETALRSIIEQAKPYERERFETLTKDLPEGVVLTEEGKLHGYDAQFVSSKYTEKHFNLDHRKVAEYFPVDTTVKGLFAIYEKFLGLSFSEEHVEGLWHDSVRVLSVRRAGEEKVISYIMLDLYPREGKFSHACQCSLLPALVSPDGEEAVSVNLVIANFPLPTTDKPSLLRHEEVTTFFHEFGHAMHAVLGYSKLYDFAGTSVKWDFVETPSQMFEGWMEDRDIIKMVSSHYKTGEDLPDEMIDALEELRMFGASSWAMYQSTLSLLCLSYYGQGAEKDTTAILRTVFSTAIPHVDRGEADHFQAAYGHLAGYAASYYAYVWSKIFALDLFSEVKEHGLLDSAIGKKFVDEVLSRGGSKDPYVLMKNFLGREVSGDAFMKAMGLAK